MKLLIAVLLVILVICSMVGCSRYNYEGWKEISIRNIGTLKIPSEWACYEEDGKLYFVDENQIPAMIETHSYCSGFEGDSPGDVDSNRFFDNYRCLRHISSTVFSNGAVYGEYLIEINSNQHQYYFLDLGGEETISLIIWDDTIDIEFVKKIAWSAVLF